MSKILLFGMALAATLAVGLSAASSVRAVTLDELPECANEEERIDISGLPQTLVAGREVLLKLDDLLVDRDDSIPYRVEWALNGEKAPAPEEAGSRFSVAPPRTGTLVISVTYALEEHYDGSYSTMLPPCRMTEQRTRSVVRPSPQKVRLNVTTPRHMENVQFAISSSGSDAEDCDYDYVRVPLSITIRTQGGRWSTTSRAANACTGWDKRQNERVVAVIGWDSLWFSPFATPGWPKKASASRSYRYVIRNDASRKVIGRGVVVARSVYVPVERVYAWLPGGQVNDDYWNYCVRNGESITMDNGNPYCTRGGYSDRTLRIVRKR